MCTVVHLLTNSLQRQGVPGYTHSYFVCLCDIYAFSVFNIVSSLYVVGAYSILSAEGLASSCIWLAFCFLWALFKTATQTCSPAFY